MGDAGQLEAWRGWDQGVGGVAGVGEDVETCEWGGMRCFDVEVHM